jgi:hypothetical protein
LFWLDNFGVQEPYMIFNRKERSMKIYCYFVYFPFDV